jgi:hypothetical protein
MTPRRLCFLSIILYCVGVIAVSAWALRLTSGHFTYALDDTYIHLALAEQIAHGHYGVNTNEFASPSSSILWPYMLAFLAGTRWHVYLPLVWNILFGATAAGLIGWFTGKWFSGRIEARNDYQGILAAVLLILSANLVSLTLVGMEHVLQVLLATCAAIGVGELFAGRRMPLWCLVAAALAPAVRYEGFSIALAVAVALIGIRQWQKAITLFSVSLTPPMLFGVYLYHLGLPPLPVSVMVKAKVISQSTGVLHRALGVVIANLKTDLVQPLWRIPTVIATAFLVVALLRTTSRARRFALGSGVLVGVLQLLLGQFNWFHRYEVFAVVFMAILILRAGLSGLLRLPVTQAALFVCASVYILATVITPNASRCIYLQQAQMQRFTTQHYHGNFAVNDLGMVSYQRTPGTYVLDLWGLASLEAAQHPLKEEGWLQATTVRHDTPLAIVFTEWFPHIPASWTRVGSLCEPNLPVLPKKACADFYSTDPSQTAVIRDDFLHFAPTVPKEDVVRIYPEKISNTVSLGKPMIEHGGDGAIAQ